jgi:endonuclease/exonuclease/phosphatase (EEP) superfamily protein YafD
VWLRRGLTAAALLVLALALTGQLVRDRTLVLAWLFYLPLLPLGLGAVLLDLLFRGRCLPRPRFGLAVLGLAAAAWSVFLLTGRGERDPPPAEARPITLLQWNVHWGGGKERSATGTWESLVADMRKRSPDIVVLSEAPPRPEHDDPERMERERRWVLDLFKDKGWSTVQRADAEHDEYWWNLTVSSAWPLRVEYDAPITHGHVMAVKVEVPERPLRLLVVDGESDPRYWRVPFLNDVAELCRRGEAEGKPIDVLAGDFNTPSRSVGFDAFAEVAGGYRLGSQAQRGWRGTFPTELPLLDIDHVWVRRGLPIHDAELFSNWATDHRGQVVRFALPRESR